MSDLQLTEDRDVSDGPGPDGAGTAALQRDPRPRSVLAAVSPAALWRRHKLFTFLVILSLLLRVLATAAFRPALLTADSFGYMQDAVHGTLGVIRPSGYSFFLQALMPFHRLLVITTVQHLMGVAVAAIVYGLLRYHGLPFWGATLAAMPTLFDTREVALESFILPDTLYCFVIVVAVALLLTKSRPRLWQCGVAGLLLAYAAVLRGNGLPVIVIAVVFMIIRRVGWRALAVGVLAAVIPVAGYVAAYHATYGQYNITSSDGIFLWSRTTAFANCAIIKPPADLRPLCPDLEKSIIYPPTRAWSVENLLAEPSAAGFLWAPDVWWRHDSDPGINAHNDKLGERFAIAAIKAQPLAYLRTVGRDVALVFLTTDRPQDHSTMTFTVQPHIQKLPAYYVHDLRAYAHTTQNTHAVQPYRFFLFIYQQPVVFGGLLFLFAVVAGLVGMFRNWRRWGGLQTLPWVIAAVSIVLPAMLTQSLYRYTIVAIPLACLAAGMAFIRPDRQAALATAGPELAAGTAPGTGPAGAVGAGAVGAGMAAGAGGPAGAVPGWETAAPSSHQAVQAPEGAESPDPDVWPSHDPDVWAPQRPDASAWPVPGVEDPVASAWTPPSGTAVRDTSAWATPQDVAPAAVARTVAAPGAAAPEPAGTVLADPEPSGAEPSGAEPAGTVPETPETVSAEPVAAGGPAPEPEQPLVPAEPAAPLAPEEPQAQAGPASAVAEPVHPPAVPQPAGSPEAAPPADAPPADAPQADAPQADAPQADAPQADARPAATPQAVTHPAGEPGDTGPQAPDPAISAWLAPTPPVTAPDTSAWARAAPAVPAPEAPSPAAADEPDWEDSLWESPAPRTSAPLQVPPGAPAWQTSATMTPTWQAPTTAGPHWQAAGPVAPGAGREPEAPAPAETAGEPVQPAGAGEPVTSPSGFVPPVLGSEAAPPPRPAQDSLPAPVDETG